jgi:hypothetical protein
MYYQQCLNFNRNFAFSPQSIIMRPHSRQINNFFLEGGERVAGGSERSYIGVDGQEHNIFGFDGSQAVAASPSGRSKAYDENKFKF